MAPFSLHRPPIVFFIPQISPTFSLSLSLSLSIYQSHSHHQQQQPFSPSSTISLSSCLKQLWRKISTPNQTSLKTNWKNQWRNNRHHLNCHRYWSHKLQRDPRSRPVSWSIKKKSPEEHEKHRVGKYAPYFQGNNILPIPEWVAAMEPKTLTFIITDLRPGDWLESRRRPRPRKAQKIY